MPERLIIRVAPTTARPCAACGKVFEAIERQLYCSRACRQRADYNRHIEKRRAARRESYGARKKS